MNRSVAYIASRMLGDAQFLYTAFAPVAYNSRDADRKCQDDAAQVLVKVGISAVPMRRLVAIHCGSPFRVAYAAFAPTYGGKRKAERIESRVLKRFREYRTRGEWLLLPNTKEVRGEFSLAVRAILQDETGRPVEWQRVTGNQLAEYMLEGKKKLTA